MTLTPEQLEEAKQLLGLPEDEPSEAPIETQETAPIDSVPTSATPTVDALLSELQTLKGESK